MFRYIHRRTLLLGGLTLFGLGYRSVWSASKAFTSEQLRLKQAINFPFTKLKPWQTLDFKAWLPATAQSGEKLLKGILVQTSQKRTWSDGLYAYCSFCPHEVCQVNYMQDTSSLQLESGNTPDHPLLVCPCHLSVFDPLAGGDVISGPAHRGLYQFDMTVREDSVQITHVESEVLTLFP